MDERAGEDRRGARLRDVAAMLAFYGRVPLPEPWRDGRRRFADAAWAAPLAGLLIGAGGALTLLVARIIGLPPFVAASLAITALVLLSGGLHEDGLADLADGFGGGRTRETKLAIMRDSRLGSYGALALILSVLLRVGMLAGLAAASAGAAAVTLIAAAAVSRATSLWPLHALPPARPDGLGVMAGRPIRRVIAGACLVALMPALLAAPVLGLAACATGLVLAALAAGAVVLLAARQIGGATGDVAGAAQQASEIAFLLGVLIFRP